MCNNPQIPEMFADLTEIECPQQCGLAQPKRSRNWENRRIVVSGRVAAG